MMTKRDIILFAASFFLQLGTYLYGANFYDYRGRPVETKTRNHSNRYEGEWYVYNFTGQPVKRRIYQTRDNSPVNEYYTYEYDHAGRLLETKHRLNSGTEVSLEKNTYDELGRLQTAMPNNRQDLKLTYNYNVRSWLTGMSGQKFSQQLYYNQPPSGGAARYNGNISGIYYGNTAYYGNLGFRYSYDNLNRLTGVSGINTSAYNASYSYDRNGNMTYLYQTEETSWEMKSFTHNGNRMLRMSHPSESELEMDGLQSDVVDYSYSVNAQYAYNANGAMTSDPYKGATYSYDALGMPLKIEVPAILGRIDYSLTGASLHDFCR